MKPEEEIFKIMEISNMTEEGKKSMIIDVLKSERRKWELETGYHNKRRGYRSGS